MSMNQRQVRDNFVGWRRASGLTGLSIGCWIAIFGVVTPAWADETSLMPTRVELSIEPYPYTHATPRGPASPRDPQAYQFPIYANATWAGAYFAPGANIEAAEDCRNTSGGAMAAFEFYYASGNASGNTTATVRFYGSTPPAGLIATYPLTGLPRNPGYLGFRHVEVNPPITLPATFWMSLEFADADSGPCIGVATPDYGTSQNQFWLEGRGLVQLNGIYSNFNFLAFKAQTRPANFSFIDQTATALGSVAGLASESSVAFVDYDRDGWDDITFKTSRIYHNDGDGTFTQVDIPGLEEVDLAFPNWADYDNDGDMDVATTGAGAALERVFRNDGSRFVELTRMLGTANPQDNMMCLAWGDANWDGHLDMFAANMGPWESPTGLPDRLWRNLGQGQDMFVQVSGGALPPDNRVGRGVAWADYDNDGDMDVYVSNYRLNPNFLLRNNRGDTMTDVAVAMGVAGNYHNAGSAWGDYDNDGDMDLIAPAIHSFPWLYRNDGNVFAEVSTAAGIHFDGEWAAGHFVDMNNDGWLDIYADKWYPGQMSRFYISNGRSSPGGPVTFTDRTFEIGAWRNDSGSSGTGCWADYDHDGDMDLLTQWNPDGLERLPRLVRNELNTGAHWLHVSLVGSTVNGTGIGSRVTVTAGGLTQIREIVGQSESGVGHSQTAHFGLGAATAVDSVVVRWPNGVVSTLEDVAANQILVVQERACSGDIDGDGDMDSADATAMVRVLIGSPLDPSHIARADVDASGAANGRDVSAFVQALLAGGC